MTFVLDADHVVVPGKKQPICIPLKHNSAWMLLSELGPGLDHIFRWVSPSVQSRSAHVWGNIPSRLKSRMSEGMRERRLGLTGDVFQHMIV